MHGGNSVNKRINPRTRAKIDLAGFLTFVTLSFAAAVGLLVLASLVVTWVLHINTVWAIPIGIGLLALLGFIGALSTEGSLLRSKLPKGLRRMHAESVKDIYIIVFGTGVGCVLAYALSRSAIITTIVGALAFI